MAKHAHIAVVGGGILRLAHAIIFARRGHPVVLFERGLTATGASIRNLGVIWPIDQPAGENALHRIAQSIQRLTSKTAAMDDRHHANPRFERTVL
jgi:D-hydroxyproline dehydrogenase subunit beta